MPGLYLFILLAVCLFNAVTADQACSDFNHLARHAKAANLTHIFTCPQDGIASTECNRPIPLKPLSEVVPSNLTWEDVLILNLTKDLRRTFITEWWLQFFKNNATNLAGVSGKIDFAMISDGCPNNEDPCHNYMTDLAERLNATFGDVARVHVIRANYGGGYDGGYMRLACKLLTGMQKIYERWPNKKYYFTIDDDTVLFPHRLMKFLRTLDATAEQSHHEPIYFGTPLNDHKYYLLCGGNAVDEVTRNVVYKHGNDPLPPNATPFCMAQGGAGYGLNNFAFRAFMNATRCVPEMDVEFTDGDQYIGFKVYQQTGGILMHCGSFRPHLGYSEDMMSHAITFHHVTADWINAQNVTSLKHDWHVSSDFEEKKVNNNIRRTRRG